MPRYFFHVHWDEATALDRVGLELPSLSDALADAEVARLDIMREDALEQLWIEVMDGSGHLVATVPSPITAAPVRAC